MNLLQGVSEAESLQSACKLIGHEVVTIPVRSKEEFTRACKYIATIDRDHDSTEQPDLPLCIHVSAHGNSEVIGVGADTLTWRQLFLALRPLCRRLRWYDGKVMLVLAACGLDKQKLTKVIQAAHKKDRSLVPPAYLFMTAEEKLAWHDSLVSWVLFYHKLPGIGLDDLCAVQDTLDKVKDAGAATLLHYRWISPKHQYQRFTPMNDREA
jgi:hypothetical protein